MEPPQLEDSIPLHSTAWCETVAPQDPGGTCSTGWSATTIDYAVASRTLAGRIRSTTVWQDYPSSPHRPVNITVDMRPPRCYRRIQTAPRHKLDSRFLTGCAPPPADGWPDIAADITAEGATAAWQAIVAAIAEEHPAYYGRQGNEADDRRGMEKLPQWTRRLVRAKQSAPDLWHSGAGFVWT